MENLSVHHYNGVSSMYGMHSTLFCFGVHYPHNAPLEKTMLPVHPYPYHAYGSKTILAHIG